MFLTVIPIHFQVRLSLQVSQRIIFLHTTQCDYARTFSDQNLSIMAVVYELQFVDLNERI